MALPLALKKIIKEITPPVLLRAIRRMVSKLKARRTAGVSGEKELDWYDASFENQERYKKHYTESVDYFLWTLIADRLSRLPSRSVLEIGCGSGQLASLLRDRGLQNYCGVDFNPKRINHAKNICPEFKFAVEDTLVTGLWDAFEHDTVLSTEVLEHVERDLEVIEKIKPGKRFIGTVPNFPDKAHVRHFKNCGEVRERYGKYFQDFKVDPILKNTQGSTYFLMEGVKV